MRTILVVEDDRDTADFLHDVLTLSGYVVEIATNGRQALKLLQSTRPTAILSDLTLPVMNGLELCQWLWDHDQYRTIPLILMSTDYRPQELNDFPNIAFLRKPFQPLDVLQATLKRVIEKAHA